MYESGSGSWLLWAMVSAVLCLWVPQDLHRAANSLPCYMEVLISSAVIVISNCKELTVEYIGSSKMEKGEELTDPLIQSSFITELCGVVLSCVIFLLFCFVCVCDILILVLILRLAFRLSNHYVNGNYYYYTICMSPVTGISSWYFSWTSGDPHRSGFKLHIAVLSVLCVMFQV